MPSSASPCRFIANPVALGEFVSSKDRETQMALLSEDGIIHLMVRG
jgi:hypothetical protein